MSRNSSGTYTLPAGNPVAVGTTIEATWANNTMNDLASEMTDSLSRSGKGGMLASLKIVDGSKAAPGQAFIDEPGSGWYRAATNDIRFSIAGEDAIRFVDDSGSTPGDQTPVEFWDGLAWIPIEAYNGAAVDITGGTIDGTPIGGTTPAAGAFTTLSATSTVTFNGGTVTMSIVDINGGFIDGTAIGASSASSASFTTVSASGSVTIADNVAAIFTTGGNIVGTGNQWYFDAYNSGGGNTIYWRDIAGGYATRMNLAMSTGTLGITGDFVAGSGAAPGVRDIEIVARGATAGVVVESTSASYSTVRLSDATSGWDINHNFPTSSGFGISRIGGNNLFSATASSSTITGITLGNSTDVPAVFINSNTVTQTGAGANDASYGVLAPSGRYAALSIQAGSGNNAWIFAGINGGSELGRLGWSSTALTFFMGSGATAVGSIPVSTFDLTWSYDVTAVDFNATSDRRLKTNIQPITSALGTVMCINGCEFDWLRSGEHAASVIAQDVETVFPVAVTTHDDDDELPGKKTVSPMAMIALLVEAVKEMKYELDDLRSRVID